MRKAVFLLFISSWAASVHAGNGKREVPFTFSGPGPSKPIGAHTYVLTSPVEPAGPAAAMLGEYEPADKEVPNLGISDTHHWLRFQVINNSSTDKLVVHIPYPEIDVLNAYSYHAGIASSVARIGQAVRSTERLTAYPEMAFEFDLARNEATTILLQVQSSKQLQVPVIITTPEEFAHSRSVRNLFIGGYFGIMMVLGLYNIFVFLSTRDKSYLFYVLYILSLCFAQLTLQGVGQAYFWTDFTWFSTKASVLFTLASMLFAGQFIRNFIGTTTVTPRLDKGLRVFMAVILATFIMDVLGLRLLAYQIAQALSGVYSLFLLGLGITAIRSGSRPARFFLLAWASFLVAVVFYILKDVGVLPTTQLTLYAMPVGSVVEGVLLSFGLADRINILRREKELSQAEALRISLENERIIREQNAILEVKVTERTLALQESNDHLKRTQTQLVNAEKMASLGQLTAGIAHEINNPVNFISSNIPPLRRDIGDVLEVLAEYRERNATSEDPSLVELRQKEKNLDLDGSITELDAIIKSIEEGAGRTAEIVRGLRNFSRLDEDDLKLADLNEGIQSTLLVLAPQLKERVRIDLDLEALPAVECHPGKLNQVFMNILNNAVQAIQEQHRSDEGRVQVRSRVAGDHVVISITDDGPGIAPNVIGKIFDPFFTTKDVGAGTGLGLSIAFSIVEKHSGKITVESIPGGGATFHITLPLAQSKEARKRA